MRASLQLQEMFGLRRQESIKLQPNYADRGDYIALKGSWTKGGRPREVPITTPEQRAILDRAHALAGAGSLIPPHRTYIQQRNIYDGQCKAAGLSHMHGLRHHYAQARYEALTGCVRWNEGGYVRHPDTAKRVWRKRPEGEWVEHRDEDVRIIPDELFQRAQLRNRTRSSSDGRLKSGGRPKYLLSGLLHCGVCNAHYILRDAGSYSCAGHRGGACDNHIRVRRNALEAAILDPLREEMLAPERVAQMAKEMQRELLARIRKAKLRATEQPHELEEPDARIARLRNRLAAGDPDMTPDELQAAIDRAERKRRELAEGRTGDAGDAARLLTILRNAAELYRRQIALGLDGAAPPVLAKARMALREPLGKIRLELDENGGLWAAYEVQPAVLLRAAVSGYAG